MHARKDPIAVFRIIHKTIRVSFSIWKISVKWETSAGFPIQKSTKSIWQISSSKIKMQYWVCGRNRRLDKFWIRI